MKKFYFYNCMLAMMFAGALSLSSCGDDNSGTEDPDVQTSPSLLTNHRKKTPCLLQTRRSVWTISHVRL